MSDFKDKQVEFARIYLIALPFILLAVYVFSLMMTLVKGEYMIDARISNLFVNNIFGSFCLGYGISSEVTIIYIFVQLFRKSNTFIKVLLSIMLIPAMLIFVFPALVATIPYYIYTYIKTNKIAIDNRPVFSKQAGILLASVLTIAVAVTVIALVIQIR